MPFAQTAQNGGPLKEWIDLGLSKDGIRGILTLAHQVDPGRKETWEIRRWQAYSIELIDIPKGDLVLVVRKVASSNQGF